MKAELRVLSGSHAGENHPIVGKQFLIGRERDCHLRPSNDLVSRHHCVLRLDDFTLRVRDLGSRNGTFINGQKVTGEVILAHGDTVFIGDMALEVSLSDSDDTVFSDPSSEDTHTIGAPQTEIFDGNTSAAPKKEYPPESAIPLNDETEPVDPNETIESA